MSKTIGIISTGAAGNTHSIKQALHHVGGQHIDINQPLDLEKVDKILLPGVGAFHDAMECLSSAGLLDALVSEIPKKPTLGICLGMQIMARVGFEHGKTDGLNLIDAEVKPIICDGKVPHMGFNSINVVGNSGILKGVEDESFYFMHSFELVNYTNILSLTIHKAHQFVSAVRSGDIFGVQFHPEKSREAGLQVFKNFIDY